MMELSVKFFEGAPKVPLGELIEARNERNSDLRYGVDLIEGVTSEGFFAPTKAVTDGINLKPYKAVRKGDFVYNPSRLNIGSLAYRDIENMCIVSHLYVVFHIKEGKTDIVLPEYMLMFFRREEFKRTIDIHNFGSQRAEFNIYQLGEIEIPLPSIEAQREYVVAYKSLQQLAEQNEALAEPIQKACSSFLSELKAKYPTEYLDGFIESCDERNGDRYGLDNLRGVSIEKVFIPTKASMDGVSLKSYKVVKPDNFCYVPVTSRNGEKITLALNNSESTFICSSAYEVFRVKSLDKLLPAFLFLFFKRNEFDRLARYNSWGSARETFAFSDLARVKIPVPPIEVQRSIVALYHCAEEARAIAREAREQLKTLAPAMVQRAANTPVEV